MKKRLQSWIIGLILMVLEKNEFKKKKKTLENLRSDGKNVYIVRENIINEMSNEDFLKWVEKPEFFEKLDTIP